MAYVKICDIVWYDLGMPIPVSDIHLLCPMNKCTMSLELSKHRPDRGTKSLVHGSPRATSTTGPTSKVIRKVGKTRQLTCSRWENSSSWMYHDIPMAAVQIGGKGNCLVGICWDLFSSGDVLPVNLTVLLKRSRIFYLDFPPWSASCKLIFLHRNTWRCLPECKPQEFTPSTLQTEEQPLVRQGISWKAHSDSLRTLKAEMVHSMDAKWKWQGPETQQIGIMEKVLTWFLDVFSFSLEFF